MSRRMLSVAVVAAASLVLAACGSDDAAPSTTSAAGSGASASDTGSSPAGSSAVSSVESSAAGSSSAESSAAGSSSAESSAAESSAAESSAAESTTEPPGTDSSPATTGAAPTGELPAPIGGECTPETIKTTKPGTLTIATSQPAYEPWMVDNDPTNGKGYESAVAYAVAETLGYAKDKVEWKRVGFDEAIAKQDGWDFDINQFSITEERKQQVDFSSGYYDITQAVITIKGSKINGVGTVAGLKDAKLGAMNGTTSLAAINTVIQPAAKPDIYDDNALAAQALQNGQIDGLVVDLPTAFYMVGAQLTDGEILGQLAGTGSEKEQFGLLLAKDSPVTACATKAVDALREAGTLTALADQWLAGKDAAPVLK